MANAGITDLYHCTDLCDAGGKEPRALCILGTHSAN